jgi:NAD(P)-dependent dehydrogenase (short-subunit alcohol dehydrogenase family)
MNTFQSAGIEAAMTGRVEGKVAFVSATQQLGRLDVIVANAGIGNGGTRLLSGGPGGSIVLTSSVGGRKAYPNTGHYCAAKHGVIGLMRAFAVELGRHTIRVNSVMPMQVNTPMVMNDQTFRLFRPDLDNPGADDFAPISQMMHTLPVPWVEPTDISNAVLFFASDESRYVTGVALPVDAGSLLN